MPGAVPGPVAGSDSGNPRIASDLLTATKRSVPVSAPSGAGAPVDSVLYMQRSKDEKEVLSKLKALTHLPDPKPIEKVTYREFVCCMTTVLKLIIDFDLDPKNYVAHMSFIANKAKLNVYATDAIIRYESAVTDRVITGQYHDWAPADPESVALHLGADATYLVRQGGTRWPRQSSASSGGNRDFSDWPKEICWLFNNTTCYFPKCRKSHICFKCKRTGHAMKDCKIQDELVPPNQPEVLSPKPTKEARKS